MAESPSFELQELTNANRHWVQTYGTSDANLKSNYTDILAVNYFSDGKILNTTFWLSSGFANSSFALNSTDNININNINLKDLSLFSPSYNTIKNDL